jgi:hypothetical protein
MQQAIYLLRFSTQTATADQRVLPTPWALHRLKALLTHARTVAWNAVHKAGQRQPILFATIKQEFTQRLPLRA